MNEYKQFVIQLQSGLEHFIKFPNNNSWSQSAGKYVDGLAAEELRRLISLDVRRQFGVFFTSSSLAKLVLTELRPSFDAKSLIYDPACGAGNLLIAVSDLIYEQKTDLNFSENILGTDIHQEFVDATKLRLAIHRLLKLPNPFSHIECEAYLSNNISQANSLVQNSFYGKATHIFVNPPFNLISLDEDLNWASGKISAAAIFVDKIIQHTNSGVSISAILPDVLRSGSRYEKWRAMVKDKCVVKKVKLLGQFDKYTDVDVFAIQLIKKKRGRRNNSRRLVGNRFLKRSTIDALFDVCVGPVVDNRDPKKGKLRGYIVSRGLTGWNEMETINLERKHPGKYFHKPFVVIKRTSRMGDSHRAIATIINVAKPVYVDNHLIILKPKSGDIKDCRKLLVGLKDPRTDRWLNKKIRCRHLTVKIVSKIPLWR